MKKLLSVALCATMLCTTLLVSPVSAGWDRNYYYFNGTTGYAYCSTGVTNYPAGYAVSVEDDNGDDRDFTLDLTFYKSGGGSGDQYLESTDFYIVIEEWGVSTTNITCLVTVDGAPKYYYARG